MRLEEGEQDLYIEGLEKLGNDKSLRHRDRSKELNPKREFLPYSKSDIWGTTQHISSSNRTKVVEGLMAIQSKMDKFSSNKHLKFYK